MQFPKLYKKSSEGKIEEWEISVVHKVGSGVTTLTYGEANGKKVTKITNLDIGLNIGKKNETTPYEQAVKEALAKHRKKLQSGYALNFKLAVDGKEDESIEGGINPMLAHRYQDHKDKVEFPVYIQPKLNGHRCIALKKNGVVSLWTRKRKPITTVPHLVKELQDTMLNQPDGTFLDGELYCHGWTLQRISSAGKKANADSPSLEFHVYDCGVQGEDMVYTMRDSFLNEAFFYLEHKHLIHVPTTIANSHAQLKWLHDRYVGQKFEGIMIRSLKHPYENKRSYSLLKMKEMMDAEFPIVGVTAGKDDTVIFTVIIPSKGYVTCDVTMSGSRKDNQKYLTDKSLWERKQLTVQFQSYTPDGSLEFPIGLQIREDI
jgi:DNA ligase-1